MDRSFIDVQLGQRYESLYFLSTLVGSDAYLEDMKLSLPVLDKIGVFGELTIVLAFVGCDLKQLSGVQEQMLGPQEPLAFTDRVAL
jgi:hypothetical protein